MAHGIENGIVELHRAGDQERRVLRLLRGSHPGLGAEVQWPKEKEEKREK